jgi:hypothetical protein
MRNLVIILVVLFLIYMLVRWFIKSPPQKVSAQLKKSVFFIIAGLLLFLVVTGRMHWLYAIVAGALPFAQRLFTAWRTVNYFRRFTAKSSGNQSQQHGQSQAQASSIVTKAIHMSLYHDTGQMSGQILCGKYSGKQLDELSTAQLVEVLRECHNDSDNDSVAVLESYLDRYHNKEGEDNWRNLYGKQSAYEQNTHPESATMTAKEACLILGLQPDANKEQIKEAHRRLMQKYHPDRGGSTYLSAKINQAKDCLLEKARK